MIKQKVVLVATRAAYYADERVNEAVRWSRDVVSSNYGLTNVVL